MLHFVGFDNHLPGMAAESRLDDEATVDHVSAEPRRVFEHFAEVDLGEAAVLHPLFDMGRQLQLPLPPFRESHGATVPAVAGARPPAARRGILLPVRAIPVIVILASCGGGPAAVEPPEVCQIRAHGLVCRTERSGTPFFTIAAGQQGPTIEGRITLEAAGQDYPDNLTWSPGVGDIILDDPHDSPSEGGLRIERFAGGIGWRYRQTDGTYGHSPCSIPTN